jgi:uncharacterized membrane protein YedE/YeeE
MVSIISLIMGVIFGAALVLAGLTDPDKIIGSLRLKDFHALRTVVLAVLVAMVGTWLLGLAGAANLDIKPAVILPLLIGGALVGLGLGLTGFCPGTGLASAASGRIDALIAVIGMFLGAHVYVLIDPTVLGPLGKVLNYGTVTLPQATGIPHFAWIIPALVAGLLVLILTRPGKTRQTEQLNNIDWGLTQDDPRTKSTVFATDRLEAAGIFRAWKNFLFVTAILCLVLLQVIFWLAHTGQIEFGPDAVSDSVAAAESSVAHHPSPIAAGRLIPFDLTFKHVASVIRPVNGILVLACVLYGLTILFALIVSIAGELGGLGQISRAFYLSVVMLILLLPWQTIFGPGGFGAIYTPSELARECANEASGTMEAWLFYVRFSGVWALTVLVLVLTQWRTSRWTKAVFHG